MCAVWLRAQHTVNTVIGIMIRVSEGQENPGRPRHHTWGCLVDWVGNMGYGQGWGPLQRPSGLCDPLCPGLLACLLGLENACERVPCWLGHPFPGLKLVWGWVGGRLPSSKRGERQGKSEVGRSWFPRRQHHVGYSPSLFGTGSPDLVVFWQASCHGDVNVQHHPLNLLPKE